MEAILTKNIKPNQPPLDLKGYEAAGGYESLRQALRQHTPTEIMQIVTDANLRGRGGAGFPTGKKWSLLPPVEKSIQPRIFIVNFDEMEPGTFKDRFLVEGDPHQLIEGALIAAYACQASLVYIFVRGEYIRPIQLLRKAVAEAAQAGYTGRNIFDSGWNCELRLHTSAGRYMCGEETGLVNALEGRRANPRTKPPYVVTSGAWGKPTVVNNVETVCCVPHIVVRGADWFKNLGRAKDAGSKIYGVSGRVKHPGAWELPIGTTLRELIEEHAGGMQEGMKFRAALPGGASTKFLDESEMDIALEYQTLGEHKAYFGTGCAIVLDERTCPVGFVHNLQAFFARESCGWCTPCWSGLSWIADILEGFEKGQAQADDIKLLQDQSLYIDNNTFCALATGAMFSLDSSLQKFRADYEAHLQQSRCPWQANA
jgi:NADH-quinone oxidoreductase subunit F